MVASRSAGGITAVSVPSGCAVRAAATCSASGRTGPPASATVSSCGVHQGVQLRGEHEQQAGQRSDRRNGATRMPA